MFGKFCFTSHSGDSFVDNLGNIPTGRAKHDSDRKLIQGQLLPRRHLGNANCWETNAKLPYKPWKWWSRKLLNL